jgi:hypothetical protein
MSMQPSRIAVGVADTVLILSAILGVAITVAHFFGWLEHVPWLTERIPVLVLLVVSLVLLDVVLERRLRLERLAESVLALRRAHESGIHYLPDAESAEAATAEITQRARQTILAVGAKSKSTKYLSVVTEAAKTRKIPYHRLLEGLYITHEVHQHLAAVIEFPNVKVSWTPHDKFANLLVTENDTVLAFPSPWPDRYSALFLPGPDFARQYTEYFFAAFAAATPVGTKDELQGLCGKCGIGGTRTPKAIAAMLAAGGQE